MKCHDCGLEILVAFSCEGRAFCPSCCARWMMLELLRPRHEGVRAVASIAAPKKAQEILAELKVDAAPLRIAKARPPPHQESFDLSRDDGGVDPQYLDGH